MPGIEARRLYEQQADGARQQYPGQRHQVRPQPGGARQPEEELLAVLDAHGIEEERKAQRSDHRRRRRLRCKPAHGQCHEENRAHAKGKSPDADLSHDIADRDREKQRHQRLLLEHCPNEFHRPPHQ